jgi:hypothetical protein
MARCRALRELLVSRAPTPVYFATDGRGVGGSKCRRWTYRTIEFTSDRLMSLQRRGECAQKFVTQGWRQRPGSVDDGVDLPVTET